MPFLSLFQEVQMLYDVEWIHYKDAKYFDDTLYLTGNLIEEDPYMQQTFTYKIKMDPNGSTIRFITEGIQKEMLILDSYKSDL